MASQIAAGIDGIVRELPLGPPATGDPYAAAQPMLPRNLYESIVAVRSSELFGRAFGDSFVDYFVRLKEFEMDRFMASVTDWEQREYFESF
jgi:glutamine synthetase